MAQQVKPLRVMPASHLGTSLSPAAPLPIQLPGNVPGKATEDGPIPWAPPYTHVGDPDEVPSSRPCPGPAWPPPFRPCRE